MSGLGRQIIPPAGTVSNNSTVTKQMGFTLLETKGSGGLIGDTVSPRVEVEYGEVVNGVYTPTAGTKHNAEITLGKDGAYTWKGNNSILAGGKTYKVTAKLYAKAGGNPPGAEKKCAESSIEFTLP